MRSKVFILQGISCSSCVTKIEKTLSSLKGVHSIQLNFATSKLQLQFDSKSISLDEIKKKLIELGYPPESEELKKNKQACSETGSLVRLIVGICASMPLLFQAIWMLFGGEEWMSKWVQLGLSSLVQFYVGWNFYILAGKALRSFSSNMFVLVILGTSTAYIYSLILVLFAVPRELYFDTSAVIITLVLLGHFLEDRSRARASEAVRAMINLQPSRARLLKDGELVEVEISEVKLGDILIVRPGEKVPVDAELIEGESFVDESLFTGESLPVWKQRGSLLIAGSLNQKGACKVKALHIGNDTMIAQMVSLVEQAQNSKVPAQKLADKISSVFVPVVLSISLLTFFFWWFSTGQLSESLITAISVLVIACPCALGLATPIVLVVATGIGAKAGVLFRNAEAIQQTGHLRYIVCDKTGTLTKGNPEVLALKLSEGVDETSFLSYVQSVVQLSEHPLSEAILSFCKKKNLKNQHVDHFESSFGKGVQGSIEGVTICLGSMRFMEEMKVQGDFSLLAKSKDSLVAVALNGIFAGGFIITDPIKESSVPAMSHFKKLGLEFFLLTGDRKEAAEAVSNELGMSGFKAEVLPDQKVEVIHDFKLKGVTGMVGDGVNDAPALAVADVGFAMRSGTDIAAEAADITLMRSDLLGVVDAVSLSRVTLRKFKQNLFFAFVYNSIGIVIAVLGYLNPMIAGVAMALSSFSVVTNALSLNRWRSCAK
jgi:Cu+-exporting ATPase